MSTQHASGPVFSPLPSYTTPPSSSSPASSSSASPSSDNNGSSHTDTTTIMFSFVIIFLGTFGLFMMGGAMYYRWKARRRRAQGGGLATGQLDIAKCRPELWEVAVTGAPPAATQARHWEDMHPLSVAVDLKAKSLPRSHMLSPPSTLMGMAGGLILPSRHVCHFSPELKPQPSHRPSTTLSQRPQSAHVAVLIAMPSVQTSRRRHPPRAAPSLDLDESALASAAMDSREDPPGLPSEFAIGTARVLYSAEDESMSMISAG